MFDKIIEVEELDGNQIDRNCVPDTPEEVTDDMIRPVITGVEYPPKCSMIEWTRPSQCSMFRYSQRYDKTEHPWYWSHRALILERNVWVGYAKGWAVPRYKMLSSYENRLYSDAKGNVRDVMDWADRMETFVFMPFQISYLTTDGVWKTEEPVINDMKVKAMNEEEAYRIATARIKYFIDPTKALYTVPAPNLMIAYVEERGKSLDGFAFEENAWHDVYTGKRRHALRVYDRTDVLQFWNFLDDFARKFSKDRFLTPASDKIKELYWKSDATDGIEWRIEDNVMLTIDPYEYTRGRIEDTKTKAEEGKIRTFGMSIEQGMPLQIMNDKRFEAYQEERRKIVAEKMRKRLEAMQKVTEEEASKNAV